MTPRPQPRPARKTSALAGRTPVEPPEQVSPPALAPTAPVAEPETSTAQPSKPRRVTGATKPPTAPTPAKAAGAKTKLGFYIDVDDAARLRGAAKFIPNELRAQGIDGFSALAAKLIMDGLAELERTYNDGRPWPSLAPGEELPRGRRVQ